ncbi:MAG TPA: hypothetical protein VF554_00700 [Thermoanaerobaculia bacterium]|jgi:hypothetical protein
MGDPDTTIDVPLYGKLSKAPDANAPLLLVFGGIDVNKISSGHYMWNYMNSFKDRFHIFVAQSNAVNGLQSYRSLMTIVKAQGLTPSKQILYLFSGGYRPGMDLLTGNGPALFSSIYLVDIWMGDSSVSNFYKALADANMAKITYVYTTNGAVNQKARDYIANNVGKSTFVAGKGTDAHMSTNAVAVRNLR